MGIEDLLPFLEAPQCGFHLCVHDRDFVPGATINKNITTAIKYSCRTILVLTPDFIKSGWCDFEFQAAHKRSIDDRSNFLVVVVLKEVDEKDLDETLKFYMKTNTYVSVNDKWFWQKMLYAMPKVPIDKLKALKKNQVQNNRKGTNKSMGGNHRNKVNKINDGNNSKNDVNELGTAADFRNKGVEGEDVALLEVVMQGVHSDENGVGPTDVPLLNIKVRDDVMGEDYTDDDVALHINVDDADEKEHHPGNNQPGKMEEAAICYYDHFSDVSSLDGDDITDSDDKEFDKGQVCKDSAPHSNRDAVAKLPPLFKRINTYNDVQ